MVGMSGKSSEPRRGPSHGKKQSTSHPASKPQPSMEALQMARMLGDTDPPDYSDLIQQVQTVVPGKSEDAIFDSLHFHNFDVEKTITALLDSDEDRSQGEWTPARKGRKKLQGEVDLIVPPGDRSKPNPRMGDSKAASQATRDNYGGSVTVGRGRSGRSQSSRGSGRSTRRSDRARPPGVGRNIKGSVPKEKGKSNMMSGTAVPSTTVPLWDSLPPSQPPVEPLPVMVGPGSWEQEEPRIEELVSELKEESPVFPEALPITQTLPGVNIVSTAETTHTPCTTSHERVQQQQPSEQSKHTERPPRHRHKRLARSQIPTKPVEMPGGIDTLDVEFGNLGINFLPEETDVATPTPPPSASPPFPATSSSPPPPQTTLLAYSEQHLPEDHSVISIAPTSTTVEHYPPLEDSKREPPPGLPPPPSSQQTGNTTPTQLLPPEPISLPTSHPSPPHPSPPHTSTEDTTLVLQEPNSEPSTLPLSSHPSTLRTLTTNTSLPPPIDLPSSVPLTTDPTTPIEPPSSQLTPHSFSTVSSSTTDLLLAGSMPHAHPSTLSTTTASAKATQAQHLGPQGKHGQLPPGMVYPPIMPQYPFSMMPVSPYYGDPNDMSRYQASVSMYYQHPTSSDPSVSGGMTREHSSTFPGEGGKFGRSNDVMASVPSSQHQTQQQAGLQQGQQMGPTYAYHYGSMFYPMYPVPGFSAPSMPPKPSGGALNYPGVSTYQAPAATGFGMSSFEESEFGKPYGGGAVKGPSLPTSTGTADLGSLKHDSKGGYNIQPMGGSGGYTFMQMPTVPMHHLPAMVPAHDSSQTRGQPKHSAKTYPFWSGAHVS